MTPRSLITPSPEYTAMSRRILRCLAPFSLLLCGAASADWQLDAGASSFHYVTSKAGAVSEVNSFSGLDGAITDSGHAMLVLDLATVSTGIDIRNQRMREIVFKVDDHPSAEISVDVSALDLEAMPPGSSEKLAISAEVAMNGMTASLDAQVRVTRLASGGVQVENTAPLLVNAATFGYAGGVEELKMIAGLTGINPNVVVDFSLVYE